MTSFELRDQSTLIQSMATAAGPVISMSAPCAQAIGAWARFRRTAG